MKHHINTIIAAAIAVLSFSVFAHGELVSKHGGQVSKHGGQVVEISDIQFEIVAKPDQILIYVTDHGKVIDIKGATAKLTLLSGKQKTEVPMVHTGDNKLEARGAFTIGKGVKAVALVTVGGKTTSVRWTLK